MSDEGKITRRMLIAGIPGSLIMSPFLPTAGFAAGRSDTETDRLEKDGVTFDWRFDKGRFRARMSAPTTGWLAAGLNSSIELKDTYFVMLRIEDGTVEAQERIAVSSGHRGTGALGYSPVLGHVAGREELGQTHVSFVLPMNLPGPRNINLREGAQVFLMLAWSQEKDFTHHSAWRRHFEVTL
ncbi:DOMON domain-containing protein [Roseibium sp. SCP14]|uniref:DOMON domain-containing protein n=1 Tax=Roseibium sp. SCP14 TaxID=3141375 RepID=UPI00333B96DA